MTVYVNTKSCFCQVFWVDYQVTYTQYYNFEVFLGIPGSTNLLFKVVVLGMDITILDHHITKQELHAWLGHPFDDMVKFVVDIDQGVIALGGEMHADAEQVLLEHGSKQEHLWGGNIYPNNEQEKIEYTSLINIRPAQHNRSMDISDQNLRGRIRAIVEQWIEL